MTPRGIICNDNEMTKNTHHVYLHWYNTSGKKNCWSYDQPHLCHRQQHWIYPPSSNVINKIPVFFRMKNWWVIPTLIWHKITTINTRIKFLVVNVDGPRNHTKFTISITNTIWRTTKSTKFITHNQILCHMGCCSRNLRLPKKNHHACLCQNYLSCERSGLY